MPKKFTKFGNRTLTIDELTVLLPKLNCSRSEAHKIGEELEIHKRIIDTLRSLLGFTKLVPGTLPQESYDRVLELFNDNPDKSAYRIYVENKKELERLGIRSYQKIYEILRRKGIESNRKRNYWSIFKDKKLLDLRDNKKLSFQKIHEQMPERTANALQFRYYRLKGHRIPSRKKDNENKT